MRTSSNSTRISRNENAHQARSGAGGSRLQACGPAAPLRRPPVAMPALKDGDPALAGAPGGVFLPPPPPSKA